MFGYNDVLQNPVSSQLKQNDNDKNLFGIQSTEYLISLEEEENKIKFVIINSLPSPFLPSIGPPVFESILSIVTVMSPQILILLGS